MLSRIDVGPMLKTEAGELLTAMPVILRVNDFDEDSAKEFSKGISKAVTLGMPFVPVVIDSYGGETYSLLAMIEAIENCPVPVATILEGKAMSCGAMLFAVGSPGYRFMSPRGHLLLHHVSTSNRGIVPKVKEDVRQSEYLDKQIFEIIDRSCGHGPGFFLDKLRGKEGADWFIKPDEAIELNLADHLHVPILTTNIRATMVLSQPFPVR